MEGRVICAIIKTPPCIKASAVDVRGITEMLQEHRMNRLERWQPQHHDTIDEGKR